MKGFWKKKIVQISLHSIIKRNATRRPIISCSISGNKFYCFCWVRMHFRFTTLISWILSLMDSQISKILNKFWEVWMNSISFETTHKRQNAKQILHTTNGLSKEDRNNIGLRHSILAFPREQCSGFPMLARGNPFTT